MHNLDRTTLEMEGHEFEGHELAHEGHEFEGHEFEQEGNEFEQEGNEQFLGNIVGGLFGEQEGNEFEQEMHAESPFHEAEAMELAAELLTVSNEQELNHFFGGLIKKAWSGAKRFASSGVGKSLLGGLKSIAKKALPMVGSALGNMVVPGLGGAIGGKLAAGAGSLLGLELEGLSAEDREFEVAKQLVNLAGAAARSAVTAPPCGSPQVAARKALLKAAKVYAPGLVRQLAGARPTAMASAREASITGRPAVAGSVAVSGRARVRGAQGRWFRRGNAIVLVGA